MTKFVKIKTGFVLDTQGNIIGKHDGAIVFTQGQRHGFTITKKTPTDKPYFVVSKDMKRNTITVSHLSNTNESNNALVSVGELNWLVAVPKANTKCLARVRHGGELLPVMLKYVGRNNLKVLFADSSKPDFLQTGQSLVLYSEGVCLGGGIIE